MRAHTDKDSMTLIQTHSKRKVAFYWSSEPSAYCCNSVDVDHCHPVAPHSVTLMQTHCITVNVAYWAKASGL